MENIYLVDGMSYVFKAYYAMLKSNLKSPSGEPTFAVFGFINLMYSLIKKENPKNLLVAFDTSEPTFRHIAFEDYKAHREEFPEQLVPQLIRIKEFLKLAKIPQIEMPGFEADDIIGSVAKQFTNYKAYCITEDKDFYQLVDNRINILKQSRDSSQSFKLVDLTEVERKFGGSPDQVCDVLALVGDTADNIPGVKGIGDKTAIPLIQKYNTLKNLYDNIDEITPNGVKEKLIKGRKDAFQAFELVQIKTDIKLPEIDFSLKSPNPKDLLDFFTELNFNQFKSKWIEDTEIYSGKSGIEIEEYNANITNSFDKKKVKYQLINDIESLKNTIKTLEKSTIISIDTETSSLDKMNCKLAGISLSCSENEAFYIAVKDSNTINNEQINLFSSNENISNQDNYKKIPINKAIEQLKGILENPKIKKCGQNIKFDAIILKRYGINVRPITFDTMIAAHILDADSALNLDSLALKYLNYSTIKIESVIGTKKQGQSPMTMLNPELVSDYASEDADVTLKLKNILEEKLNDNNLIDLANNLEFPLIEVLIGMEFTGVKIDDKGLNEISEQISKEINVLRSNIFQEAGEEFNVDSPKQLGEILFNVMMIPPVKKTKTGYSTDVDTLNILKYTYPIADYLLKYRQLAKLKSTYIDALPMMINPSTGRLHTNYNQAGTNTGRLSSNEPNLQNIPIKSELGKEVRKAFIGENDNLILSADYSQIELRIMAYFSQDQNLKKAFIEGKDVHTATAAILNNIDISQVNSQQRGIAKTVNFGIMYGLGAFGLAQRLGLSRNQGSEIIKNYFEKYPGIYNYMADTIASTKEKSYAETILKRRRYFPEINSMNNNIKTAAERAAINMPIQGSASDMIKIAMIRIYNQLIKEKLKSKMIMQVHDELVFECLPDEIEKVREIVKYNMENALSLGDIPVVVEIGSGKNWLEAH